MKKLILISFIFLSCKSTKCSDSDIEFVKNFNSKIEIVEREHKGKEVNVQQYVEALVYLSKTTNIYTHAEVGTTLGYQDEEEYKSDMKLWKEWLKKNKCND